MIRFSALVVLLISATATPVQGADPAVARPSFPIDGEIQTQGLVFFVPADAPAGAAAIGTAHTFDLEKLLQMLDANNRPRLWLEIPLCCSESPELIP